MIENVLNLKDYTGEEKLYAAILQVALEDLEKPDLKEHSFAYFIRRDQDYPESFTNVCRILGISDDKILTYVKNLYIHGRKSLL